MYYCKQNHYGSETSCGFANTWFAIKFPNKAMRDDYCNRTNRLDIKPITAKEANKESIHDWGEFVRI